MSKKICILTDSLSYGGAEKVAANMSVFLSEKGYSVFIVSMHDDISYSFNGELYNFGKAKAKYNKIKAFLEFKNFFKKHNFDFIIDHRIRSKYFKELLFSLFVFKNYKVAYCIHSFKLSYYFSFVKVPWLASIPHVKRKVFITVSSEIENYLKDILNIKSITIYNFYSKKNMVSENQHNSDFNNYIIGVGRLNKTKQFDKLIKSYSQSNLPKHDIKLIILGDGKEKQVLENLIKVLNLKHLVKLIPFINNPDYLIKKAKALVLTSKVEGFPMVLLEALSLNTPVISFNCKSGPKEIIMDGVNGLLIENQNITELTLALNKLIDDTFYANLKNNTHIGLERFSKDIIIQEWINVLENHK